MVAFIGSLPSGSVLGTTIMVGCNYSRMSSVIYFFLLSFAHLDPDMFCLCFLAKILSVRLAGDHWWTTLFKSVHQTLLFRILVLYKSSIGLAVCFISFYYASLQFIWLNFISFLFSSRTALYLVTSIVPSALTSFPMQAVSFEKHPYNTILPPPCFTVGVVFSGWWAVFIFQQI